MVCEGLDRVSWVCLEPCVQEPLRCICGTHASVGGSVADGLVVTWMAGRIAPRPCTPTFRGSRWEGTSQLSLPLDAAAVFSLTFSLPSSQDFFLFLVGKGYLCNLLRSIPPSPHKVLHQHKCDYGARADFGRKVNKT